QQQLLDQRHALLQLLLPLLELLHFRQNRIDPRDVLLRGGDLLIDLRRLLTRRPVPPADPGYRQGQGEAAGHRHLRARIEGECLARLRPFDAEKVDADHRSVTRRSARPTATAAVADTSAGSPPSFLTSHSTVRNGSNSSTGALKRSCNIS